MCDILSLNIGLDVILIQPPYLICSNISLPVGPHGRTDIALTGRWPHMDQNPLKTEFELMQGFISVTESGKGDGGQRRRFQAGCAPQKLTNENA